MLQPEATLPRTNHRRSRYGNFLSPMVWLCVLILAVNFFVICRSVGPNVSMKGADESQWVINAVHYWKLGVGSPIGHVPLFHDLIVPFVGGFFVDPETGYAIWKYLLFFVSHLLVFYATSKVSNIWIGLSIAIYFQFTVDPWGDPTYSHLAMTLFLLSVVLVLYNRKLLGGAFGVLLLGSLVRLELLLFAVTAACLLLLFSRKSVLTSAFFKQLALPVILFVGLIYWHGSSLTRFPREYMFRGQQSVVWYVIDFMYNHGYFSQYAVPNRGNIPLDVLDTVLTQQFGKDLKGLNQSSFLEIYHRNPTLIKARYTEMVQQLPSLIASPFIVRIPYGGSSKPFFGILHLSVIAIVPVFFFRFFTRVVPLKGLLGRVLKYLGAVPGITAISPPKEAVLMLLSALAGFLPWLMTSPQPHYVMMALPLQLMIFALLFRWIPIGLSWIPELFIPEEST